MPKGICYNASRQERRKCSLWHAKSPGVATSGAFLFRCGKVAYALGWLPPIYLRPAICRCSRRLHLPRQRVSEEEYRQLQEKILESGKNQQEYILSCVLEKQIVNTDGIKELIPELKRIGNNLNQIAKRCNEGGMLPSEAEVRKHGEELNKVWQSLRRYLQRRA